MAHFAKLKVGNIVERVEVVSNDIATTEQAGVDFLNNIHKSRDVWKQTPYNTIHNTHKLGGTPFRGNYAGIGFSYDASRDVFIPPKPFNSWILNETTYLWEAPLAKPNDNNEYNWNEQNQTWDLLS